MDSKPKFKRRRLKKQAMKEAAWLVFFKKKKKGKEKKEVPQVCFSYANSSLKWLVMKMHL